MDLGGMMKGAIVATVTIVVVLLLVSAIGPGAITSVANTTAINATTSGGYDLWSSGTQTTWGAIQIFGVLAFFLIIIAVVIKLIG